MKLRIKGNSLRLRLTRGEVERLSDEGFMSETMSLPGAALEYSVHADKTAREMSVQFADQALRVTVPAHAILEWAATEQISLSATHGPTRILVEKDFACLQPREGEDDSDAFPHPGQAPG